MRLLALVGLLLAPLALAVALALTQRAAYRHLLKRPPEDIPGMPVLLLRSLVMLVLCAAALALASGAWTRFTS